MGASTRSACKPQVFKIINKLGFTQYSTCIMITAIVCSFLQKHLFVCCFSFHIRNNTIYASFCCVCGLCRWHELWCDPEFLILQVLGDTIESKPLKLQQQTPKARLRLHHVIFSFHADLYLNTRSAASVPLSGLSLPDRVRVTGRAETRGPGVSRA